MRKELGKRTERAVWVLLACLALALAARTAVYAAEQLYRTGTIRDRLEYAEKWLESHGYAVDRAQIEAQVKQMRIDSVMETITTADEEEKDDE